MAGNNKNVELVISARDEVTKTIDGVIKSLDELGKDASSGGLKSLFNSLTQSADDLKKKEEELATASKQLDEAQSALSRAAAQQEKDFASQQARVNEVKTTLEGLNAKYADLEKAATAARQPSEKLTQTLENQTKRQKTLAESIQSVYAQLQEARKTQSSGQLDQQAVDAIEKRRKKVIELGQAWRQTGELVKEAQSTLATLAGPKNQASQSQQAEQAKLDNLRAQYQETKKLEQAQRELNKSQPSDQNKATLDFLVTRRKRLSQAIQDQVLVERTARQESNAANKAYSDQAKVLDKLVGTAGKQKDAYKGATEALAKYDQEQKKASQSRQIDQVNTLEKSLGKLMEQYQALGKRVESTQARITKASAPDPRAVQQFTTLKESIAETQAALTKEQGAMERLRKEYATAGASSEQLAASQQRLDEISRKLASEQEQVGAAIRSSGNDAEAAGKKFKLWGDDSRQALSFIQRIRGELLSLAAGYTGIYAIGEGFKSLYDNTVVTQQAVARLSVRFGNNMHAIQSQMAFVKKEADRLGLSYQVLLERYTKFLDSVPKGTMSLQQIQYVFHGLAVAARGGGLSTQQLNEAFLAFEQIASKHQVQMQELKLQLGNALPGAVEKFAKALSEASGKLVTTKDLMQEISKGNISSDALVPFAKELIKYYGPGLAKAIKTPQAQLQKFQTTVFETETLINKSGFFNVMVDGFKKINREMQTPAFKEGIKEFAKGLVAVSNAAVTLVENIKPIGEALTAIAAVKTTKYFYDAAVSFKGFSDAVRGGVTQLRAADSAVGKLRLSLRLLAASIPSLIGAFTGGFAIGTYLQKQYPQVREFGATLVGIFEKAGITLKELWRIQSLTFTEGWKTAIRKVAEYVATTIPRVVKMSLDAYAALVDHFNHSLAEKLRNMGQVLVDSTKNSVDGTIQHLFGKDTFGIDVQKVRDNADKARKAVDDTITQMFLDIQHQSDKHPVLDPKKAAEQAQQFSKHIQDGLTFITSGQITKQELKNLQSEFDKVQLLKDRSQKTSLDSQLKAVADKYKKFLQNVQKLRAQVDSQTSAIQRKEKALIDDTNGQLQKGLITSKQAADDINKIRQTSQEQIKQLHQDAAKFSGADQITQQVIAIQQATTKQKFFNEERTTALKEINKLTKDRKTLETQVSNEVKTNQISYDEQRKQLAAIADEYLPKVQAKYRELIAEAKKNGNADLASFLQRSLDAFNKTQPRTDQLQQVQSYQKQINKILTDRQDLVASINAQQANGDITVIQAQKKIKQAYSDTNAELQKAIIAAIKYAKTLDDPDLVHRLEALKKNLVYVSNETKLLEGLSQRFAAGFTNAFDSFVQGTKSAGQAFRQFISDFLRQIADALLQATIFNSLMKAMGVSGPGSRAGGLGGALYTAIGGAAASLFHDGGIVGEGGKTVFARPEWFRNAVRYHTGGIVGLKPDEVPAILQKGEKVIPKNQVNQSNQQSPQNIKIVNAIDSASVVSEGLNSAQGQKVIMNILRANKAQVKQVLA